MNHSTIDRLVLLPEMRKALGGISNRALAMRIKAGAVPQPVRLSKKTQGWPLSQVQALIRGELPSSMEPKC